MGPFAKTLGSAAALALLVSVAMIVRIPAIPGSGIGKVIPGIFATYWIIALSVSWAFISSSLYIYGRIKKATPAYLRELGFTSIFSLVLAVLVAGWIGSEIWSRTSFQTKLKSIDDGRVSVQEQKHMIDESLRASGAFILKEPYHVVSHIASSRYTQPEVLLYFLETGDITSDFWGAIIANPNATSAVKDRVAALQQEAISKWGGLYEFPSERIQSRTRRQSETTTAVTPTAGQSARQP